MDSWGPSDPKLANQFIISFILDPNLTFFAILGFFGEVGDHFFSPFGVVQSFRHKSIFWSNVIYFGKILVKFHVFW